MLDFKILTMRKNFNSIFKKGVILTSAITLLSVASCKKYTELNPINSLSEATAFTSAANIELVMAGVYSTAAVGTYNGGAGRGYPFGAASIEQSEMRGEDMVNLATFYQITYESTYDGSTANNVNMWTNLYALINQCNIFIAGVEAAAASGTITSAVATQYEGEARFLRALAHHELVIDFCRPYVDSKGSNPGIPYRTVAVNSTTAVDAQVAVPRGTVADDYTKILADLDYAETNLPATRTAYAITRATKGAAIALKTRVKLHMEDFAGVITEGTKLGTSSGTAFTSPIGSYKLTTSPDGPFTSFTSNTESVFSIENSAAANGGVNGALPNMFGAVSATINGVTVAFGGRG
ncbi:MAG: RagB/SusD family nutrient uptake outer membrane protein, partial [Sphingobacteriaceae bacterium]